VKTKGYYTHSPQAQMSLKLIWTTDMRVITALKWFVYLFGRARFIQYVPVNTSAFHVPNYFAWLSHWRGDNFEKTLCRMWI